MTISGYNEWQITPIVNSTSFTGTTGTIGRTYTLLNSPVYLVKSILLQGSSLTANIDYTVNGQVITFNTYLDDGMICEITYSTGYEISTASGNLYTSAELVQAELRASTIFSSSTLPTLLQVNQWIAEESAIIDSMCGFTFAETAVSSTYIDYDGDEILRFPHVPLVSISEVKYNVASQGQEPNWVTFEEGFDKNYISYLNHGEIEFINGINRTNNVLPLAGKKKFCLSYSYGFGVIPLEVQRLATLTVAKRVISSLLNTQANSEGGSIQIGTISITDPSQYGVNYIKNMNNDIETLRGTLGYKFNTHRSIRVY